jgi:hypothetical protein
MAKGGLYSSRKFAGLSGVLQNHHTNIQALFHRYLGAKAQSRPAIAKEILFRLQAHLAMEADVLFEVIRSGDPYAEDLVENAMLEHEDIQTMFSQLMESELSTGIWVERFQDMMQTAQVHFITEERDLLPLVDRSRDA